MKIGATPITTPEDIIRALGMETHDKEETLFENIEMTDDEKILLSLLDEPLEKDDLIEASGLAVHKVSIALSKLEMKGFVKESMGKVYRL